MCFVVRALFFDTFLIVLLLLTGFLLVPFFRLTFSINNLRFFFKDKWFLSKTALSEARF